MSVGYSPLAIYAPLFLQHLHGVSPLGAGYMVALASLAWTTAALAVASLSEEWPPNRAPIAQAARGAATSAKGTQSDARNTEPGSRPLSQPARIGNQPG